VGETVLPISSSTLCYGSNDGGLTVLKKEAELSRKVEQACKWLHLKRHIVGNKEVALYGPGPSLFLSLAISLFRFLFVYSALIQRCRRS
jgi:hypothetical protein